MRFLIDAMLPSSLVGLLEELGHDATTPTALGTHNLPDECLVELAAVDGWVIVTENASDFAAVTTCPVLLVRKSCWPSAPLAHRLAAAFHRWAEVNPGPGPWPHWLPDTIR